MPILLFVLLLICPIVWGGEFLADEDILAVQNYKAKFDQMSREEIAGQELSSLKLAQQSATEQLTLTPGFYPVGDPLIPAAVNRAADSVFQITAFWARPVNPNFVWSMEAIEETLKNNLKHKDAEKRIRATIAQVYYENCKKLGQTECYIPIFAGLQRQLSSGFLLGESGKDMVASQHFFQNIKNEYALKRCSPGHMRSCQNWGKDFDYFVLDSKGRVVADPFTNPVEIIEMGTTNEEKDYSKLRFQKRIGPGLRMAVQPALAGDPIYHFGYASCTGCLEAYKENGGNKSFALRGTRYPFRDAEEGQPWFTIGNLAYGFEGNLLIDSADGVFGMSGGVTLNERGEALGIIMGVNAEKEEATGRYQRLMFSVPLSLVP